MLDRLCRREKPDLSIGPVFLFRMVCLHSDSWFENGKPFYQRACFI